MNPEEILLGAIEQCGSLCTLHRDGQEWQFVAVIQPRSYDTQMRTQGEFSQFGQVDPRQFIYYGPLSQGGDQVMDGAILETESGQYEVLLCHDFFWKNRPVFRWAVARRLEGMD